MQLPFDGSVFTSPESPVSSYVIRHPGRDKLRAGLDNDGSLATNTITFDATTNPARRERDAGPVELDVGDRALRARMNAELARQATEWYLQDTDALGLGRPDALPKATEVVPQIISFISELIDRGHAYESDGDVYFRVASFPDYGKLSGRHGDEEATRNPSEEDEAGELKARFNLALLLITHDLGVVAGMAISG